MFQVGDMVCYPMHGVGTVEAIQEQSILGETNQYYLLRFLMGRMTALVPVKNKVVEYLKSGDCSMESDNWNQRYRENLDKLKQGDALVVADVVKCLMKRDQERGLSAGERKMYMTARQVLVAELCASSGKGEEVFLPLVGGA